MYTPGIYPKCLIEYVKCKGSKKMIQTSLGIDDNIQETGTCGNF